MNARPPTETVIPSSEAFCSICDKQRLRHNETWICEACDLQWWAEVVPVKTIQNIPHNWAA